MIPCLQSSAEVLKKSRCKIQHMLLLVTTRPPTDAVDGGLRRACSCVSGRAKVFVASKRHS
jgi:hypothetical protein